MMFVGISIVKNEEDIIESFVRHNLKFLDGIVIFDNNSIDATKVILQSLMHEGLPVCLASDNEFAFLQSKKMTNFLHRVASAMRAEFVLPLDADEFIECESRQKFEAILDRIPRPGIGLWAWKTYLLPPDDVNSQLTNLGRLKYHRIQEFPPYNKVIIRVPWREAGRITIASGSHMALHSGEDLPFVSLDQMPLAHFPLRSKTQIYKKTIRGGLAYQIQEKVENKKTTGLGYQQKNIFRRILHEEIPEIELANLSLNYAQLPGELCWPENVCKGKLESKEESNRYDGALHASSILVDVIKNFQHYIYGPVELFDPLDVYRIEPGQYDLPEVETAFAQGLHTSKLFLDIPPFEYIFERFSPESVLDVGCGLGKYVRLFNNFGVSQAIGIDATIPDFLYIRPENYILHDLHRPISLQQKYGLVLCCEFAEHLRPGSEKVLLDSIEAHATNLILFSAAAPNQQGNGHINCRPFIFWAEQWIERCWAPLQFETLSFRALATFSWFRRNPVVLGKTESPSDARQRWEPFIYINSEEYVYPDQSPEIITNPLTHSFPL